ncbi:MAG: HAD-IIIA family hydrolase [Candidatus Pacearchaeota archaeon]
MPSKKPKDVLVCIDRDGTLIYDDKYYLGRSNDWKNKIEFLRGVVSGIRRLKKEIPNVKIYMITNQKGVAIKDYKLLDYQRAREVCEEILERLRKKGAKIDGYILCPHADKNYKKKHPDKNLKSELVCNCSCIKPNTGMIDRALENCGLKKSKTDIYVVGDRESDVKAGLNSGGYGILVPFENEPREKEKVRSLRSKKSAVVNGFGDASRIIVKKEN